MKKIQLPELASIAFPPLAAMPYNLITDVRKMEEVLLGRYVIRVKLRYFSKYSQQEFGKSYIEFANKKRSLKN